MPPVLGLRKARVLSLAAIARRLKSSSASRLFSPARIFAISSMVYLLIDCREITPSISAMSSRAVHSFVRGDRLRLSLQIRQTTSCSGFNFFKAAGTSCGSVIQSNVGSSVTLHPRAPPCTPDKSAASKLAGASDSPEFRGQASWGDKIQMRAREAQRVEHCLSVGKLGYDTQSQPHCV